MISQEMFDVIESQHGCGYWHECTDKACPCAITMENKGLREDIWEGFKQDQRELIEMYKDEEEFPTIERCRKCGTLTYEDYLYNGLCLECDMEEDEDDEYWE